MDFNTANLDTGKIFLVLSEATDLKRKNIGILKILSAADYQTIVITTNQPYSILKKMYEKDGLNLQKVVFIDAITRYALGTDIQNEDHCRYINNPGNLTDIGIAVTEVLKKYPDGKVCILLDSVSTMLIYISSANITKFIHFVTNKLRLLDVAGIFLAVEKGLDPTLLLQLTSFVDMVINGGDHEDTPPPDTGE
jgi:archaellum biogenesis ATPase FlaH